MTKQDKVKELLESVLFESNALLDKDMIAKNLIVKVKRAIEKGNLTDYNTLKAFTSSFISELDRAERQLDDLTDKQGNDQGRAQTNSIVYVLLNTPAYKRVLDQFYADSKFDLARKISFANEMPTTKVQWSKNMDKPIHMHMNSVQKKGKVLKEEEVKSTDAFEVFDEVRKNLQDAQSALVINIPNKYQTLYQDELAGLYDELASTINKVLNLTKKMKGELQQ